MVLDLPLASSPSRTSPKRRNQTARSRALRSRSNSGLNITADHDNDNDDHDDINDNDNGKKRRLRSLKVRLGKNRIRIVPSGLNTGVSVLLVSVFLLGFSLIAASFAYLETTPRGPRPQRHLKEETVKNSVPLLLPRGVVHVHTALDDLENGDEAEDKGDDDGNDDDDPNNGNDELHMEFLPSNHFRRNISQSISKQESMTEFFTTDDGTDPMNQMEDDDYDEAAFVGECRPTMLEQKHHHPLCNTFQELGLEEMVRQGISKPISHGDMNRVWLMDTAADRFIFKGMLPGNRGKQFDFRRWAEVRREGIVGSAASTHPRIVSNFGFCGLNVVGEFLNRGSLHDLTHKKYPFCGRNEPLNVSELKMKPLLDLSGLTVTQKLQISLDMAEAVAVLHNHPDGVIVHGDLWIGQYMIDSNDKDEIRVKLNDFNMAEFIEFDPQKRQYCPYVPGKPRVDFTGSLARRSQYSCVIGK